MTNYPSVSGKEVVKALSKIGFEVVRTRGSHRRLKHSDGRITTVPVHSNEDLRPGTLHAILRDVGIDRDELQKLL
jgi:predicted RNA binding protein YcfA (HicA-like mRNA interferase family)